MHYFLLEFIPIVKGHVVQESKQEMTNCFPLVSHKEHELLTQIQFVKKTKTPNLQSLLLEV